MRPRLTVRLVVLPLLVPFSTRLGRMLERRSMVLEYEVAGVRAYSECATFESPGYWPEDNSTALHILREYLLTTIADDPPPSPAQFSAFAEGKIRGNRMAKAAVEMLLWDYHSKAQRKSLTEALGNSKGFALSGISLGLSTPGELVAAAGQALDAGYRRIKLKIEPGQEERTIGPVRDAFPGATLCVDANGAYRLKDLQSIRRLDAFDLEYLEQPLGEDDILDHSRLAKEIATPICLDESISSTDRARQALEIGAASVVNIKPGRLGGLSNSIEVAKIVREAGGHAWVGGMLEMGVGRAFNVALASQQVIDLPGDTSPNGRYFARDIVTNPFTLEDGGTLRPNAGEGIGALLDEEYLDSNTVERWKLL